MCLYETMIKNRKYTKNKKNGGVVPSVTDTRMEWIPISCGNCIECRKKKAREWQIRLIEDIKENKNGKFITLTFSNENIKLLQNETIKKTNKETGIIQTLKISDLKGYEKDNQIATKAIRLFNERWRKKYKKAIRHWLVTEIGHRGTENIHLHGIIWTNESIEEIRNIWKYGYIWPRPENKIKTYVNARTVNYIIKYISKIDQRNKEYKSLILSSPGIGKNYITSYDVRKKEGWNKEAIYKTSTGHKISLPTYLKNKIFTENERETMWINQLDKGIKWICGEKINTINNNIEYEKLIQYHRQRNSQLGYGGKPNENRKQYEEKRRETLIQTRIQKAKNGNGRPPTPHEMG